MSLLTIGQKPKYNSKTEKKAALGLAKKLKRLSKKEQKQAQETNSKWIFQYLSKFADQVTQKVERQKANTNLQAVKRLGVKHRKCAK